MKIAIYIDGFNLFYGLKKSCKKQNHCKWLDLSKFCNFYLKDKKYEIQKIKYFTARIKPRADKPMAMIRQQTYLRALETLEKVEIIEGYFFRKKSRLPLVPKYHNKMQWLKIFLFGLIIKLPIADLTKHNKYQCPLVFKSEEKGSDVNIASHLINDAHNKKFDKAIIVSNDSDLAGAIEIVVSEIGLEVEVWNPHEKNSQKLKSVSTGIKKIRTIAYESSQFPNTIKDRHGTITIPAGW